MEDSGEEVDEEARFRPRADGEVPEGLRMPSADKGAFRWYRLRQLYHAGICHRCACWHDMPIPDNTLACDFYQRSPASVRRTVWDFLDEMEGKLARRAKANHASRRRGEDRGEKVAKGMQRRHQKRRDARREGDAGPSSSGDPGYGDSYPPRQNYGRGGGRAPSFGRKKIDVLSKILDVKE